MGKTLYATTLALVAVIATGCASFLQPQVPPDPAESSERMPSDSQWFMENAPAACAEQPWVHECRKYVRYMI